MEVIPAALLRADLDDLLALLVGVEHRVDARNVVRGGLLDVDVLARRQRVDHLLRVPVIRRGDQDRIDVLAIEDPAVIADHVELEGLPRRRHPRVELRLVHLGGGDPLDVRLPRKGVEHAAPAVAAADDRHPDAIVGALDAERGFVAATAIAAAEAFKNLRLLSIVPVSLSTAGLRRSFRVRRSPRAA